MRRLVTGFRAIHDSLSAFTLGFQLTLAAVVLICSLVKLFDFLNPR